MPPAWHCYPWDAQAYGRDVSAHESLARQCAGDRPLMVGEQPLERPAVLWFRLAAAAAIGATAALLLTRVRLKG